MTIRLARFSTLAIAAMIGAAHAADAPLAIAPVVSLSASATLSVPNDRVYAWLRAEVENADPARAAADVNVWATRQRAG